MHRRHFITTAALAAASLLFRPQVDAPRLVAFGDSITCGLGASAPDRAYAARVAAAWGLPLVNCAISGAHLVHIAACAAATPLTPADTVIALVGYNDMRAGTDRTTFRAQLDAMLSDVRGRAGRVVVGNCLRMTAAGYAEFHGSAGSDAAVYAFNQQIAAACAAAGVQLVDACGRYQAENVTSDLVHPNDAGHAQIAAAFIWPWQVFAPVAG